MKLTHTLNEYKYILENKIDGNFIFFSQNIEKIYVLIFEPCNFKKFKILFLYFFKNVKP